MAVEELHDVEAAAVHIEMNVSLSSSVKGISSIFIVAFPDDYSHCNFYRN